MPKMLAAKNTKLTWVTSILDVSAPKLSELTGGLDVQCLISAQNFQLGATDEETTTDPAMCSMSNASAPGRTTYAGEFDFFRYTTTVEDIGWTTFTQAGLNGYWVKRIGKLHSTPYAATDKVMVYQTITGTPMVQTPDNNVTGYEKFRLHSYIQDLVDEHAVVAA